MNRNSAPVDVNYCYRDFEGSVADNVKFRLKNIRLEDLNG